MSGRNGSASVVAWATFCEKSGLAGFENDDFVIRPRLRLGIGGPPDFVLDSSEIGRGRRSRRAGRRIAGIARLVRGSSLFEQHDHRFAERRRLVELIKIGEAEPLNAFPDIGLAVGPRADLPASMEEYAVVRGGVESGSQGGGVVSQSVQLGVVILGLHVQHFDTELRTEFAKLLDEVLHFFDDLAVLGRVIVSVRLLTDLREGLVPLVDDDRRGARSSRN